VVFRILDSDKDNELEIVQLPAFFELLNKTVSLSNRKDEKQVNEVCSMVVSKAQKEGFLRSVSLNWLLKEFVVEKPLLESFFCQ